MTGYIWIHIFLTIFRALHPATPQAAPAAVCAAAEDLPAFRNPMNIPIELAANFGEIRRDHFHMGLDIRTRQRENLPVYAAADGYISRVSVAEGGFGNALYITHFNGYTTVYAHLNGFESRLARRVKEMQYERESWSIDVTFKAGEFPVKAGDFIAYSGNTGASGGPHLHFEIRETKTGRNLNPQQFGFNIPDNIAPVVQGLYWYDRRYSTYDVQPQAIAIRRQGAVYTAPQVVRVGSPRISLGLRAQDRSSNSPFYFGIYKAALHVNEQQVHAFAIDNFDYTESRYVNAAVDYSTWVKTGRTIQHLSRLPGNRLGIYEGGDGLIDLSDGSEKNVRVVVSDIQGNRTEVQLRLQYDAALDRPLLFAMNRIPLPPLQPAQWQGNQCQVIFDEAAFYDTIPFVAAEAPGDVSPVVSIGRTDIPLQTLYQVKLRPHAAYLGRKDRIIMQFKGYRLDLVTRGTWEGDWLAGRFNKFGTARLVVDETPPLVQPLGWRDGGSIPNNGRIRLRVTDNYKAIALFRAELNGKWLMFRKAGSEYVYTVDEHAPPGTHRLKVVAEDVAGNRTETYFTVHRVEKLKAAPKKRSTRKRR